ncbi:MAG TPA: DUF892 family protein [Bryobacteraceae bacterium]|nr:DUF892 family protein [Bryobacteraceae bacterium]
MAETGNQVLRRYLDEAITAEKAIEAQLEEFAAAASDDSEIQELFRLHAGETRSQQERLAARLTALGGSEHARNPLASFFEHAPKLPQAVHTIEERALRNLIAGYTAETAEIAFYEALANVARAAGDPDTEALARAIQDEERIMAEKLWYLLPSRSKIAFNMLTVTEVDPAVETKMADDRVGS